MNNNMLDRAKYIYSYQSVFNIGDIDDNGFVDTSDASAVLADYVAAQTGEKPSLNAAQLKAADIDGNGTVDASDASTILAYYAYVQTSQNEIEFSEYLKI